MGKKAEKLCSVQKMIPHCFYYCNLHRCRDKYP